MVGSRHVPCQCYRTENIRKTSGSTTGRKHPRKSLKIYGTWESFRLWKGVSDSFRSPPVRPQTQVEPQEPEGFTFQHVHHFGHVLVRKLDGGAFVCGCTILPFFGAM